MRPFDLERLAPGLRLDPDGIWRPAAPAAAPVSYPTHGNQDCYQVEEQSFWFRHRSRCIEAVVARFPPAGVLLDVGGGNGFVAQGLGAAGFPAAVLEAGADGARNARRRGIEPVIAATLDGAGFRERALPAICMFDVLEHIADDRAALRLCRRLLAPAGLLYLTVPAHAWLWSRNDEHAGHQRRYSPRRLRALLDQCGFEMLYDTALFGCLLLPILVKRTLLRLFPRRTERTLAEKRRDHVLGDGVKARLLDRLLRRELGAVRAGRRRALGTSILLVARARETQA